MSANIDSKWKRMHYSMPILTMKVVISRKIHIYHYFLCYYFIMKLTRETTRMEKLNIRHLKLSFQLRKLKRPSCYPFTLPNLTCTFLFFNLCYYSYKHLISVRELFHPCLLVISYQNFKSICSLLFFIATKDIKKCIDNMHSLSIPSGFCHYTVTTVT